MVNLTSGGAQNFSTEEFLGSGGGVCHKSRSSYAIKVGSCTAFSVEVSLFRRIFMPYDPSFMAHVGVIFFGSYGGWGWSELFSVVFSYS